MVPGSGGFSRLIGSSSCLLAKLWALRYGIAMAKTLNISKLIINVDASEVINLLSKPSDINRLTQPIADDCRNMLQAFKEHRMQHCFRETNKAADLLAKLGHYQAESFASYVTTSFIVMKPLLMTLILYNLYPSDSGIFNFILLFHIALP